MENKDYACSLDFCAFDELRPREVVAYTTFITD